MCPMVPTFTCGLLRSNFSLAMSSTSSLITPTRPLCQSVFARRTPSRANLPACQPSLAKRAEVGADDQNRTGDLVLTKDALCQLSYIGLRASRFGRQVGRGDVSVSGLPAEAHARRVLA